MLGNIISQLYRIADLLKDKKLVDKDSNSSSQTETEDEIRVKPLYVSSNSIIRGCLVKEKDFVHVETEQTTLGEIFPNVINDISNIINTNFDNIDSYFNIFVENSSEVLEIVQIDTTNSNVSVTLDKSGLETAVYNGLINRDDIGSTQLTQGYEDLH